MGFDHLHFIIVYGRMIEIYLVTSIAHPMATMMNRESGNMGQNYLFSVCSRISGVPHYCLRSNLRRSRQNIAVGADISAAI